MLSEGVWKQLEFMDWDSEEQGIGWRGSPRELERVPCSPLVKLEAVHTTGLAGSGCCETGSWNRSCKMLGSVGDQTSPWGSIVVCAFRWDSRKIRA